MPTTMNFALSPTLLSHLTTGGGGNGVFAYAFAFEGANLIPGGAVTLVNNGVAAGAPSVALTTAGHTTFSSGKVYIVIQQTGAGGTSDLLSTVTHVGDINSIDSVTRELSLRSPRGDTVELGVRRRRHLLPSTSSARPSPSPSSTRRPHRHARLCRERFRDRHGAHQRVAGRRPEPVFQAPGNAPLNELRNAIVPANNFAPNPIPAATGPPTSTPSRTGRATSSSSRPSTDPRCSRGRRCRSTGRSTTPARIRSGWFPTTARRMSTDYINISTQDLINNVYCRPASCTSMPDRRRG